MKKKINSLVLSPPPHLMNILTNSNLAASQLSFPIFNFTLINLSRCILIDLILFLPCFLAIFIVCHRSNMQRNNSVIRNTSSAQVLASSHAAIVCAGQNAQCIRCRALNYHAINMKGAVIIACCVLS